MVSFLKPSSVPFLVVCAMLALTMPRVQAQSRVTHTRPIASPRQFPTNRTPINRTRPFNTPSRFHFDPFRDRRFGFDPFLRSRFGFDPFLGRRFDRFEDRFERRFGFDPFLRSRFGFDPFLGSGFGFNPLLGGGFGSLGSAVIPSSSGSSFSFSEGGATGNNGLSGSLVDQQQAALLQEQVLAGALSNRRRLFDEYLYEREKAPTAEQQRQRIQQEQLNRSLNTPPVTEILSGKALNDVLADLRGLAFTSDPAGPQAFPLQLDEEGLKHINVTTGAGNIALLKNEGRLNWPLALSGVEFEVERDRLAARTLTAVRQAEFNNHVDASTIQQMTADLDTLDQQLRRNGRELPAMRYIGGKTFLHNFADAIKALAQDDVGSHFNGNYVLKAKTVPELVKHLTERGLQFARALPGDESAYVVLHQALATYDRAAQLAAVAR